jgi:hypothetical protein
MTPRRLLAALTALVVVGLGAPAAHAQVVDIPEPTSKIGEVDNWSFDVVPVLLGAAVLLVVATAVGYVVKAREFKANQRRGGSK